MSSEETLSRDLRIKASMINLGERIAWGSETALMDAAADRIDALEAENARLERLVSHWQGLALMNRKVADDALAQLAAIQGGMGETIEPCADLNHHERYRAGWNACLAQHQRITAAMAAEVETWRSNAVMLEQANAGLAQLNGKLRTELAEVKGQEAVEVVVPAKLTGATGFAKGIEDGWNAAIDAVMRLNATPQPSPDVRALVSADDVRDACANAVSVFAEEANAAQCREVAEYMREVLLAQIARRQEQPQ